MIQAHYIYCALHFCYYYISSTSDHQTSDSRGWGPQLYCLKLPLLRCVSSSSPTPAQISLPNARWTFLLMSRRTRNSLPQVCSSIWILHLVWTLSFPCFLSQNLSLKPLPSHLLPPPRLVPATFLPPTCSTDCCGRILAFYYRVPFLAGLGQTTFVVTSFKSSLGSGRTWGPIFGFGLCTD